jgi:hypothetical protein
MIAYIQALAKELREVLQRGLVETMRGNLQWNVRARFEVLAEELGRLDPS